MNFVFFDRNHKTLFQLLKAQEFVLINSMQSSTLISYILQLLFRHCLLKILQSKSYTYTQ